MLVGSSYVERNERSVFGTSVWNVRQPSVDGFRSCALQFWDTAWQLARRRWFMTGQESHRWMGRSNVNQICSLTTQESNFSVPFDRWKWPDFNRETAELISFSWTCVLKYLTNQSMKTTDLFQQHLLFLVASLVFWNQPLTCCWQIKSLAVRINNQSSQRWPRPEFH